MFQALTAENKLQLQKWGGSPNTAAHQLEASEGPGELLGAFLAGALPDTMKSSQKDTHIAKGYGGLLPLSHFPPLP